METTKNHDFSSKYRGISYASYPFFDLLGQKSDSLSREKLCSKNGTLSLPGFSAGKSFCRNTGLFYDGFNGSYRYVPAFVMRNNNGSARFLGFVLEMTAF